MPGYVAFLRAINVGGRTVQMETLRTLFVEMGFTQVETFIASGNVIFHSGRAKADALEKHIETNLHQALGYEVVTFLRTFAEVATIAASQPFPEEQMEASVAWNVALLKASVSAQSLESFHSEIDSFQAVSREVHWLCKKKQSESKFSNTAFERALKSKATFRNMNTLRRLAAKYPAT